MCLYKDLTENQKKEEEFLKRLDKLDQLLWKLNKDYLESEFLGQSTKGMDSQGSPSGSSGPNMPLSGTSGPKFID